MHAGVNRGDEPPVDPWEHMSDRELLRNSEFHAWMTYGVIMKTLARFEFAMGRRIGWSFPGHQIKVSPHGFNDANAFYSDRAQGLFFGYFPSLDRKKIVFTCLSHEIVVHETRTRCWMVCANATWNLPPHSKRDSMKDSPTSLRCYRFCRRNP